MPLFGLVWATSWVGYLLASNQGLLKVPDYLISTLPTNVFSVVSSPIETPTPLFATSLYSGTRNSKSLIATVPNSAFKKGTGSFQFRQQQSQLPVHLSEQQSRFCRTETEPKKDVLLSASTTLSSSGLIQETSPRDASKDTLPQKIFQVMGNLLAWHQHPKPANTLMSSVEVVGNTGSVPVEDTENGKEQRVKLGFWQYSQLLKRRLMGAVPPSKSERFQVRVKGHLIAQLPNQQQADLMAQRLKQFFSDSSDPYLNASLVEPALVDGLPAVKVGDRILFKIDQALAKALDHNGELLAVQWANNLRIALGKVPLKLAEAQRRLYNLVETPKAFKGKASWYGPQFHGRTTATGEKYSQHELTAAHPSLPFDTFLKVRNLKNGKSVIVRINDRGPYARNRTLDLSREAARCLNSEKAGIVPFEAVIMRSRSTHPPQYLVQK